MQSATGRFEAGIQRHEYRNCILRYTFDPDTQNKFTLKWLNPSPELCEGVPRVEGWEEEGPDGKLELNGVESQYEGCPLPGPDAYFGKYTIARLSKAKRPYSELPDGSGVYHNCLIARQYDPVNDPTKKNRYRVEAFLATLRGPNAEVPIRFYSTDANRYSISRRVLPLVRRTLHVRKHLAIGAASPVVSARRVISPFTCSTAAGRSARQTLWLLASLEEALWSERAAPRSVRTSRLTKRSVRTSRAQGPDLRRRRRWGPPPECLRLPGDAQLAARTTAAKRVALVPVPACR